MLISHKHHFIFIHVIKNAGTSIGATLLPFTAYNRIHLFLIRMADSHGLPLPKPLTPRPMKAHAGTQNLVATLGRENYLC
jgi:hypothetical protein